MNKRWLVQFYATFKEAPSSQVIEFPVEPVDVARSQRLQHIRNLYYLNYGVWKHGVITEFPGFLNSQDKYTRLH